MGCVVVVGTRPEIIKMSAVVRALADARVPFWVLHTCQHYDPLLAERIMAPLGFPAPRHHLGVGSAPPSEQTARILAGCARVFRDEPVGMVLVQGDTNTVAGAALAAAQAGLPLGHVEAGLRSGDRTASEEVVRILADHLATHAFAPTEHALANLVGEGIGADRALLTGNTVVDALHALGATPCGSPDAYVLATAHRAENVDDPARLAALVDAVGAVGRDLGLPVIWPCHPRTRRRLVEHGIGVAAPIQLMDPLPVDAFVALERRARLVLTDSGGVQEETCVLRVPCVTLREVTERPETVAIGANLLAGLDPAEVVAAARAMIGSPRTWSHPFGDGHAGRRIAQVVRDAL